MTVGLLTIRTAGTAGLGGGASGGTSGPRRWRRALVGLAEVIRWDEPWDVEVAGELDADPAAPDALR